MKHFMRFIAIMMICIFATGITVFASADSKDIGDTVQYLDEIMEYVINRNAIDGIALSQKETEKLRGIIYSSAQKYADEYNVSLKSGMHMIYEEVVSKNDYHSYNAQATRVSHTLPSASAGAIFYIDTTTTWNHVGLYTNVNTIVEAMPEDGVQFWGITAPGAIQTNFSSIGTNTSCILIVSATSTQKGAAAAWPGNNVVTGTPYDWDFADNKSDYYSVYNPGTQTYDGPFSEGNAYNCSELVWKAYYKATGIDLDNDGGLGVYPNDIYNSGLTTATQVRWWE